MNQLTAVNQSTTNVPADINNIGYAPDPQPHRLASILGHIAALSAACSVASEPDPLDWYTNSPSPYTTKQLERVHMFLVRRWGLVPKVMASLIKDQRAMWRA